MIKLLKDISLQGVTFQLESLEAEKVKAGGSSSSDLLNRYFATLAQDVALIVTQVNSWITRASKIENVTSVQGAAYVNLFNSLSSRVNSASGFDQVLVDLYSNFFINSGSTTANISRTYGQATLPVKSTQDLLVSNDVYGNTYISDQLEFSYIESTASSPPSNGSFQVALDGLYMLRGDQPWLITSPAGSTEAFVKLKAPLQYKGLTPNVLEFWPIPMGVHTLKGIWYQTVGAGSDGIWNSIDISYLPGYTSSSVPTLGPIRIHLPNVAISQIAIKLDISSSLTWGIHKLSISHTEYESTGTLTITDPYSRTIGDIVLRGKDPSTLSSLSSTKVGSQLQLNLTSTDSAVTPVITGIIMSV